MATAWHDLPPYSNPTFTYKYRASCFCKRVRFEVQSDPVTAKICDCSVCMRLHGAPMQWAALFKKDAVKFAADSLEWLRWYKTDTDTVYLDGAEKQLPCKIQCKHCGTWIADEGRTLRFLWKSLPR
eukprot:TRINITY_DN23250_c0_g1_i2.p1 TRINITY_DN23250_c0_g1~~TRINITY_DN23250_c0_g1_i2.p1  ORF type:complete len:126 (-),score=10.52 TRINITY_DN23250_c0_g1_i2:52-429(-)